MYHEHIHLEDARRFARLAAGLVPAEDPRWVVEYAASVQFCDACGEIACRANTLVLADQCGDRTDPNDVREDCLSPDDIMELEEGTPKFEHLRHCAACQLRYYEALALSELGGVDVEEPADPLHQSGSVPTVLRIDGVSESAARLLQVGIRITRSAAGLVGALILEPDLVSGLLGPEEDKPVAEGIVRRGHPLEKVRIEIDDDSKVLTATALPPSCPGERIRLCFGAEIITPSSSGATEAHFDISRMWQAGDHTFDLILADPST